MIHNTAAALESHSNKKKSMKLKDFSQKVS